MSIELMISDFSDLKDIDKIYSDIFKPIIMNQTDLVLIVDKNVNDF